MIGWIFGMCLAVVLIVGVLVLLAIRRFDREWRGLAVWQDEGCLELTEEDDGR